MSTCPGRTRPTGLTTLAAAAAAAMLVSCSMTPQQRYQRRLVDTGEPALHAVHSQRLEEVMAELNQLALDRMPQELDPDVARNRRSREIAVLAAALADTAQQIPAGISQEDLTDDERRLFINLTDKLRDQALELNRHSADNNLAQTETALYQITATCNACHSAFRELPQLM